MRLILVQLAVVPLMLAALILPEQASAISQENLEILERHFASLGKVGYELYVPFGGPEIGGAVIETAGQASRLHVVQVGERGGLDTLISKTIQGTGGDHPFTFLLNGQHILLYPTDEWEDPAGFVHRRGDLTIHDLAEGCEAKVLFELKDVLDLSFLAAGALSPEITLWQQAPHFLNWSGVLPIKYDYARLSFEPGDGKYEFFQHLTALPGAGTVEEANFNNRAIYYYRRGMLVQASRLLEQAAVAAESDQSVILHNQALVNCELDDLAAQGRLVPDRRHDEALLYFWEGEFTACLGVLEGRQVSGLSDMDLAMLGMALAQERRWPEADNATLGLTRQGAAFLADYMYELVKIAEIQRLPDVIGLQLMALEAVDPAHPGCIAAKARLLRQAGQRADAERILNQCLNGVNSKGYDLAPAREELYELYYMRGFLTGCEQLVGDALKGPVGNLRAYVELADYVDLGSALADISQDDPGRILAPDEPLESISLPERQLYPPREEDAVRPIE